MTRFSSQKLPVRHTVVGSLEGIGDLTELEGNGLLYLLRLVGDFIVCLWLNSLAIEKHKCHVSM